MTRLSSLVGTGALPHAHLRTDYDFDVAARAVTTSFDAAIRAHGTTLFTTDAKNLFEIYLAAMPLEYRQEHNCNECRRFIERFGGLVTIDDVSGEITPAMWGNVPRSSIYAASFKALGDAVARANVNGLFVSAEKNLGVAVTGDWHHFAVKNPNRWAVRTTEAHEQRALKLEHYGTLERALNEFSPAVVAGAVTLLKSDSLYRSEKVLGAAEFLHNLHEARRRVKRIRAKRNLIWKAIATAPAGFCTPRSGMIGTLLEDIVAGHSFESAGRRFAEKMHPLRYQRPQAAPKAGNIAQADKLVEQLGLERSFARRFARFEEVPKIWVPRKTRRRAPAAQPNSIFSRLKQPATTPRAARTGQALNTTPVRITFDKFRRTVLPEATAIEVLTDGRNTNYGALTTAANASAPLIFQWDNPFAWYVYSGGSRPQDWALPANVYIPVTGIALQPSMMQDENAFAHQGKAAFFIIEGAKDRRTPGLALFPENLRADLHKVRATVERFSRTGKMGGALNATACGLIVGRAGDTTVRVQTSTGTALYLIDRFD